MVGGAKAASALALTAALFGCDGASGARAERETTATSASTPTVAPTCGQKGQSDCPLQNWMKATLQPYQREGNFGRLARAFEELAEHAPQNYGRWADLAHEGAEAARKQDAGAVRTVCKNCHDELRARYRRELRAAPFL
jgi:hypothetical protein